MVTPTGVLEPGWLEIDGDRITQVEAGAAEGVPMVATIAPGLVDIHVHGGGGASFSDSSDESLLAAVEHHRRRGTTTVCASLMTASLDELHAQVTHAADFVEDGILAGIHLEGPWLSPLRAGAHDTALFRAPNHADVRRLLSAGRGAVRMVTLAPELDGGLDAIRLVVEHGAVAALGHTDADYVMANAALEAGATHGTHLGNGMRPFHHRDPGVILALLQHERAVLELINDGVHLHDAVITAVIVAVGTNRGTLVSDAVPATGLPDGEYALGGVTMELRGPEVRHPGSGSLAGSAMHLADSLRRAVLELGVPLADAVAMATSTPAGVLGLTDVGRLEASARADLIVLDDDLQVTSVMHRGSWLPS